MLRREGFNVNHKRVHRLYCQTGLQLRNKNPKRKVKAKARENPVIASAQNDCWSMDFMADNLFTGEKIRVLTVVDNFTKISPVIDVKFSYKAILTLLIL